MIRLNHCIKLDTPEEVTEDSRGCKCYQKEIMFLYNFEFYQVECCRGWFNYMLPRGGLHEILNMALISEGMEYPYIQEGYAWHHRGTKHFWETCTTKPSHTIHAIPVIDIIENTDKFLYSRFQSYDRIIRTGFNAKIRTKAYDLHSWNLHKLDELICPRFLKKDISQQIEILVKELRKTIRDVNSKGSEKNPVSVDSGS